jgi:hypothetical protein
MAIVVREQLHSTLVQYSTPSRPFHFDLHVHKSDPKLVSPGTKPEPQITQWTRPRINCDPTYRLWLQCLRKVRS